MGSVLANTAGWLGCTRQFPCEASVSDPDFVDIYPLCNVTQLHLPRVHSHDSSTAPIPARKTRRTEEFSTLHSAGFGHGFLLPNTIFLLLTAVHIHVPMHLLSHS